jgi:hypothetical protein
LTTMVKVQSESAQKPKDERTRRNDARNAKYQEIMWI